MKSTISVTLFGIALILMIMLLAACDKYSSKDFEISTLDMKACTLLADSLSDTLATVNVNEYDSTWTNREVNTVASSFINSLEQDQIMAQVTDEKDFYFELITASDTSYAGLMCNYNRFILYCDDFLKINCIDEDGIQMKVLDEVMPLETISGCMMEIENVSEPRIKMRQTFAPQSDRILIQFIKTDQTKSGAFRIAFLP